VKTGDRFGLRKFGSRMDVFVYRGVRLLVKAGDVVRAGETRLAEFPSRADTPARPAFAPAPAAAPPKDGGPC